MIHGPATSQSVHAYQSPKDTPHTPPLFSFFVTCPSINYCWLVTRDIAAGDMDDEQRTLGTKTTATNTTAIALTINVITK